MFLPKKLDYILQMRKIVILASEKPGCAILPAEKAPAGMGTPRPGFAKLRVSSEGHFCCAKIAQWSGPRTAEYFERKIMCLLPDEYVFFSKRNVSSSKRNMSSSHRKRVFFKKKICLLQRKKCVYYIGGEGRCPVRFRAGAGMNT